jgi:pimeloyl-ACP methyl ester carboxylesterase
VKQLRLDANGLTFAALAWGEVGDPLALCVHGYPDTAWTWRHLGPYLADRGWRAVAPFTRGYAPTDLASDDSYLVSDLARDILALHTALSGDDRAALIGHDWGAVATYAVAAVEPSRFHRYVTLAVPPPAAVLAPFTSLRMLPLAARQARMSWYFLFNQLPVLSERALDWLIPKLWRDWSPGYDAREDLADVFAALDGDGRDTAALRYYRALFLPWMRQGEYAAEQAHAHAVPAEPLLYLYGEDDGCLLPEISARTLEVIAPGSRVEAIPGAGHFLHLERPDEVNTRIGAWLES